MKKLSLLALVVAILISAFSTPLDAEEKLRVAVMDLANKTEITGDEARSLSKQIRMVASATLPKDKFLIMTKDNIKSLLPPEKSLAQCTTAKCVIELGRMISADYIITGSIIHFAEEMRIDFGAHHSLSADSLGGRTADAGNLKGLEAQLKAKSTEIMGLIMSHAGVAPPARSGGGAVFVSPTQPSAPGGAAEVRALAPSEQPPATATGPAGLYITTSPPGAEVYLGEVKAGTAKPAFQKVSLQPGTTVRVTLKMSLYHDVSFDVALKPGVMKFEGVELKPAYGSLKIESEPSGAEVLIGGSKVGSTPFSDQRYPSGQYLVTVKKEWYLPQEDQQITVSDGQATNKMYALSQDFGTLDVKSKPSGAKVSLDGKKLGATPGSWRVSPVNNGKVKVSLVGYRGKSFEINIDRGQAVKITPDQATLQAKLGSLQVYADPPEPGAKVYVDGKEIGPAPVTVSDLAEGRHKVKVETKDKSGTSTVNIQEGQTAVATVKLKQTGVKIWGDNNKGLLAIFHTTMGDFTVKLFPDKTPETVANFVGLATGTKEYTDRKTGDKKKGKFYDGLSFHRVIPNFMIQGGRPLGTGTGDPGYKFKDEFDSSLKFNKKGLLAMANSGPGTNGSQFFITVKKTPWLNNKHTIFGEVVEGYDIVKKMSRVKTARGDKPVKPLLIESLEIKEVK